MKKLIVVMALSLILLQGCVMIYSTRDNFNGVVYETEKRFEYHADK